MTTYCKDNISHRFAYQRVGKFRSLTEAIDTSGPAGRMLMQMLGSFAEFEREMIPERTRAGLREARASGRVPGRKPKITAEQQKEIAQSPARA